MFNVINVLSYMDHKDADAECVKSMICSLHEYSTDIIRILTNVTIFIKIQDGKFKLDPIDFNIRDCIEETMKYIKKIDTSESHVNITFHLDNLPNDKIHVGDRTRVQHVLNHILTNALNHTESGDIVVNTSIRVGTDGNDEVVMTVSDTGVGIPEDRLEDVYKPFHTPHNGVGLGLFISKYIVELMDGCIGIDSTENEGTAVTVKLPIKKS
jgi:signal transduction histidine kinase